MSEGYTPSEIDDFEISDTATGEIYEESQCIIIDIIDGKLTHCEKKVDTKSKRTLNKMFGIWEIHFDSARLLFQEDKSSKLNTFNFGVCISHFNFDKKPLHPPRANAERQSIEKSWIHRRKCLFCNDIKFFFSQGEICMSHSHAIHKKTVLISCAQHLKMRNSFNMQPAANDLGIFAIHATVLKGVIIFSREERVQNHMIVWINIQKIHLHH